MHVTVRHYAGNSQLVDALAERQDEIKGIITPIEGFNSYYLVRTGEGDAMSVSVFESAAGGEQSVQTARDWIAENLSDLQVSPPQVLAGDAAFTF